MNHITESSKQSAHSKSGKDVQHVYAIVRVDDFHGPDVPTERRVTVKRVMRDADGAEREVERLNNLRKTRDIYYFAQLTRLDEPTQAAVQEECTAVSNRLSEYTASQQSSGVDLETLAWLEEIEVPERIYLPPPTGYGFPAFRVYCVLGNPTVRHCITYGGSETFLFQRNYNKYIEIVGVSGSTEKKFVTFAFRIFDDLFPDGREDLTPLNVLQRMAEQFGMTIQVGNQRAKFLLESEYVIPNGMAYGQFFRVENPATAGKLTSAIKLKGKTVQIALAFCVDIMKYWNWVKDR